MNTKIGYYPILDAALAIRQIFSVERFKPFNAAQEAVNTKLSESESAEIDRVAACTNDWLDVIARLIDMTIQGIVSPEEVFIKVMKEPAFIFGENGDTSMVGLLSDIWYNHCSMETSRYANQIRTKSIELSTVGEGEKLIDYILKLSDRIEKKEDSVLKFNIKPDLSIPIDHIENIIIMPSVFSSRNVAFWYSGNTFLFYVAVNSNIVSMEEPSDMLLLRTLALNDKTRLKMLKLLASSPASVNEMAEKLHVNASTVSRHFKVFKDVAFVDIQSQEGNSIYYCINKNELQKAMQTICDYVFLK